MYYATISPLQKNSPYLWNIIVCHTNSYKQRRNLRLWGCLAEVELMVFKLYSIFELYSSSQFSLPQTDFRDLRYCNVNDFPLFLIFPRVSLHASSCFGDAELNQIDLHSHLTLPINKCSSAQWGFCFHQYPNQTGYYKYYFLCMQSFTIVFNFTWWWYHRFKLNSSLITEICVSWGVHGRIQICVSLCVGVSLTMYTSMFSICHWSCICLFSNSPIKTEFHM